MDKSGKGLQIAFGMTFYGGEKTIINDPDYAEIKARMKIWDGDGIRWEDLATRPCTREELGLEATETLDLSKFYPPSGNSKRNLEAFWDKLFCYDDEISISGNYDSAKVSHLHISLVKCNKELRDSCKSEEEIQEWMKRLFLIHVNNQKRFDQTKYREKKIANESIFVWHAISSEQREEEVFEIHNYSVNMKDTRSLDVGDFF